MDVQGVSLLDFTQTVVWHALHGYPWVHGVPECSGTGLRDRMRNADAGGINLDTDAQLC